MKFLNFLFKSFGILTFLTFTFGVVWFAFWFLVSVWYGGEYNLDFDTAARRALWPSFLYALLFLGIPTLGLMGFTSFLQDVDEWLLRRKHQKRNRPQDHRESDTRPPNP